MTSKYRGPGAIVNEAVERFSSLTARDPEFAAVMSRWERPESAPRYDLEDLVKFVRWAPSDPGTLDLEPFIRSLRPPDRPAAAGVALWVYETYGGLPATDKTLNSFRLELGRRLDACGF